MSMMIQSSEAQIVGQDIDAVKFLPDGKAHSWTSKPAYFIQTKMQMLKAPTRYKSMT